MLKLTALSGFAAQGDSAPVEEFGSQQYTSGSGTFTAPVDTLLRGWMVGGGGGGGGGNSTSARGGAGGGGGAYIAFQMEVTAGQEISYSVGAAGSGGASNNPGVAGTAGGNTSFGSRIAGGGGGGAGGLSSGSSNGGSAGMDAGTSSGDEVLDGGRGVSGSTAGGNGHISYINVSTTAASGGLQTGTPDGGDAPELGYSGGGGDYTGSGGDGARGEINLFWGGVVELTAAWGDIEGEAYGENVAQTISGITYPVILKVDLSSSDADVALHIVVNDRIKIWETTAEPLYVMVDAGDTLKFGCTNVSDSLYSATATITNVTDGGAAVDTFSISVDNAELP